MGIMITDKNADFSAVSVGFAGLYTEVSTGLVALHELRDSTARTVNNAASDESASFVLGAPAYSEGSVAITPANTIDFGVRPTGERSFAFIANIPSTLIADYAFISSTKKNNTLIGGDVVVTYSSYAVHETNTYPSATTPLTTPLKVSTSLPVPSTNAFELIVVTLKNGVGVTVYHPRLGTSKFTAVAAGQVFATDNAPSYKLLRDDTKGSYNVAMFALWNRPLTAAEVTQFYADIKPQMLSNNVVI